MGKHLPKLLWAPDKERKGGGRWYIRDPLTKSKKHFPGGNGKSDRTNYRVQQEAAADFLQERAEARPHREDYEKAIHRRRAILEWMTISGETDQSLKEAMINEIAQLEAASSSTSPPALNNRNRWRIDNPGALWVDPVKELPDPRLWAERLASLANHKSWESDQVHERSTIKHHTQHWKDEQENNSKLPGGIRETTLKTYHERIDYFADWAGEKDITKIEGQLLKQWKSELIQRAIQGKITTRWAVNVMVITKRFTRWLVSSELIDKLPLCWDDLVIPVENPSVVVWTKSEIKCFIAAANERTELFILLCLNCGFYSADCGDLRQDEVDWTEGRITRKRTKTNRRNSVPEVTFLLWDRCFQLLKKHRSSDPEYVLLNERGGALLRMSRSKKTGKRYMINNVDSAFDRVVKKMKWRPHKSMDLLRKTAADTLKNNSKFQGMRQYFLGQAGKFLFERRYATDGFDDFDLSQVWLGEQFGYETRRFTKINEENRKTIELTPEVEAILKANGLLDAPKP